MLQLVNYAAVNYVQGRRACQDGWACQYSFLLLVLSGGPHSLSIQAPLRSCLRATWTSHLQTKTCPTNQRRQGLHTPISIPITTNTSSTTLINSLRPSNTRSSRRHLNVCFAPSGPPVLCLT